MPGPTPEEIEQAAAALAEGRLVVFPTETVYGLGAHALDPDAVARIFAAKGRPADNPLIVHVADADAAQELVAHWPDAARNLAERFWPGPLTMVLPKSGRVPDITTGGLDSVAVRVPGHPVAQALLAAAGLPVAAPSANRSGRPSPTRVGDARADLSGRVAVYLDGGPTEVGVESTVVDLRGKPAILRPGGVARADLEAAVGPLAAASAPERSPGTRYRHYAPRAAVHLAAPDTLADRLRLLRDQGLRVAALASTENAPPGPDIVVVGDRRDAAAWARRLFALLRDLDAKGFDAVVVEELPEGGLGEAVMDRLRRAAREDRA